MSGAVSRPPRSRTYEEFPIPGFMREGVWDPPPIIPIRQRLPNNNEGFIDLSWNVNANPNAVFDETPKYGGVRPKETTREAKRKGHKPFPTPKWRRPPTPSQEARAASSLGPLPSGRKKFVGRADSPGGVVLRPKTAAVELNWKERPSREKSLGGTPRSSELDKGRASSPDAFGRPSTAGHRGGDTARGDTEGDVPLEEMEALLKNLGEKEKERARKAYFNFLRKSQSSTGKQMSLSRPPSAPAAVKSTMTPQGKGSISQKEDMVLRARMRHAGDVHTSFLPLDRGEKFENPLGSSSLDAPYGTGDAKFTSKYDEKVQCRLSYIRRALKKEAHKHEKKLKRARSAAPATNRSMTSDFSNKSIDKRTFEKAMINVCYHPRMSVSIPESKVLVEEMAQTEKKLSFNALKSLPNQRAKSIVGPRNMRITDDFYKAFVDYSSVPDKTVHIRKFKVRSPSGKDLYHCRFCEKYLPVENFQRKSLLERKHQCKDCEKDYRYIGPHKEPPPTRHELGERAKTPEEKPLTERERKAAVVDTEHFNMLHHHENGSPECHTPIPHDRDNSRRLKHLYTRDKLNLFAVG